MSTTNPATQPAAQATSSKADRLAEFLRAEAADGETYFKAKFIADDVGLPEGDRRVDRPASRLDTGC